MSLLIYGKVTKPGSNGDGYFMRSFLRVILGRMRPYHDPKRASRSDAAEDEIVILGGDEGFEFIELQWFSNQLLKVNRETQALAIEEDYEGVVQSVDALGKSKFFQLSDPAWSEPRRRAFLFTIYLEAVTAHIVLSNDYSAIHDNARDAIRDAATHKAKAWRYLYRIVTHGQFSWSAATPNWTKKECDDINENLKSTLETAREWRERQNAKTIASVTKSAIDPIDQVEAEHIIRHFDEFMLQFDQLQVSLAQTEVDSLFYDICHRRSAIYRSSVRTRATPSILDPIIQGHADKLSRIEILKVIYAWPALRKELRPSLGTKFFFGHTEIEDFDKTSDQVLEQLEARGWITSARRSEWKPPAENSPGPVHDPWGTKNFLLDVYPEKLERSLDFFLGLSPLITIREQEMETNKPKPGDTYNIGSAQLVVGTGASTGNITVSGSSQNDARVHVSYSSLAEELRLLRATMVEEQSSNPAYDADDVESIAAAERAANAADPEGVKSNLAKVGGWVVDVATKIGVGVATAAIKDAVLPGGS